MKRTFTQRIKDEPRYWLSAAVSLWFDRRALRGWHIALGVVVYATLAVTFAFGMGYGRWISRAAALSVILFVIIGWRRVRMAYPRSVGEAMGFLG